eukprot:CAMPEP_0115620614 /NCGR_PEP_ID=MMETSP0272-20121206/25300_1 /TAXON_ID=71861 /ORGANISM="Scrippsiella trochoidea, Strain CCMP3099" /LENGTH=424 /DNA_ID=CAMNT_0003056705 /DNA_START=77 /DNA_END=1351 /DNA_ORIENTATION=+
MTAVRPSGTGSSKATQEHRWQIPSRYEIRQVIGTGSYGSVCEAYDKEQGKLVAVKRIRHLFDDLVDCKRILREVAILSRISHESVVQLHDVVAPTNVHNFEELFIIMEICDSDLKKLCRTDVTLSPLHINTLLYNLLIGVKCLHAAGIYHRDLKPANCLVNQDCTVKICDFGLSRAIDGECGPDALCAPPAGNATGGQSASKPHPLGRRHLTGHVVTRWYRAPELILLQENYTAAIDLWSVGCIHAELLGMLEGIRLEDRGPLFPGSSCFPLSPDNKHKTDYKYHTRGKHDQLSMIFNLLGTPSEEDIARLEREDTRRYIRCFAKREGEGLRSRFPHVDHDTVDLLGRFLHFNPQDRMGVNQALEHPIFSEVRLPEKETMSSSLVSLDFEKEPDLDEVMLRDYFRSEMKKFRMDEQEKLRQGGA